MSKTHYRKVFKSDHLGVADLEDFVETGSNLKFTISHVNQEIGATVAGKKINANIAYFNEKIKPLVLNATNSKTMRNLTGSSFIDDWADITVQLYIDKTAQLMGEIVGGVRISPNKVSATKEELTPNHAKWGGAVAAFKRDGNLKAVMDVMTISRENQQLIIDQATDNV